MSSFGFSLDTDRTHCPPVGLMESCLTLIIPFYLFFSFSVPNSYRLSCTFTGCVHYKTLCLPDGYTTSCLNVLCYIMPLFVYTVQGHCVILRVRIGSHSPCLSGFLAGMNLDHSCKMFFSLLLQGLQEERPKPSCNYTCVLYQSLNSHYSDSTYPKAYNLSP